MIVNVTQQCINEGEKGNPNNCPVALAIQKEGLMCSVHPEDVRFDHYGPVDLPQDSIDWITSFDDGQEVEPFSFVVGHLRS